MTSESHGTHDMNIETSAEQVSEERLRELRELFADPALDPDAPVSIYYLSLTVREARELLSARTSTAPVADTNWRDCFAEITAKATPLTFDEKDPERILSYAVPAGPIHRAAGKMGFQFFGGEEAAKQWQQRAERAETWRAAIEEFVTSMKETTIPEIEAAIQERQTRAADPAFRNRPLFGASPPPPQPGVRVTRWSMEKLTGSVTLTPCVRDDGEWVKFDDVQAALAASIPDSGEEK